MKPGGIFLNLSRGHIVDIPALAEAIREGMSAVEAFNKFGIM